MWSLNMRINIVSTFTKNYNIMKFSFCFVSIFLSRSHGDQQSLFSLLLWLLLVLAPLWCQSSIFSIWNLSMFLAHPGNEWYCLPHSAVSWCSCGSPPRLILLSCWFFPQLNVIRRHIVRWPRFLISGSPDRVNNFLIKLWGSSQKWMILPGP